MSDPNPYDSYDHLFEDDEPEHKVKPGEEVLIVPGVAYYGDMHKHSIAAQESRLWHMQEDDKTVDGYATQVSAWINDNERQAQVDLSAIAPPRIDQFIYPGSQNHKLDLFDPRDDRKRRTSDAIKYTSGRLIDAFKIGKNGEESFVKKLLPPGVHIGEAMIVFDKDKRYREVVASACYKVIEQLAKDGYLDSYERVKDNRDYKTVSHGDPAIARGRNRDVVVGMTLDMLSGRFNADENRKTSEAMGDNNRDKRGVFNGGHHSGVAFQVMHILTDPARYDQYFGQDADSPEALLATELESKDFIDNMSAIEPAYGSPEVNRCSHMPGRVEAHLKAFEFTPEHHSEVVVEPCESGSYVAMVRSAEIGDSGQMMRGMVVRDVAKFEAIKQEIQKLVERFGADISPDDLSVMTSHVSRKVGNEKFVAEGESVTIGRGQGVDIQLKDSRRIISKEHAVCSIDAFGKICVKDKSTNGSVIRYR